MTTQKIASEKSSKQQTAVKPIRQTAVCTTEPMELLLQRTVYAPERLHPNESEWLQQTVGNQRLGQLNTNSCNEKPTSTNDLAQSSFHAILAQTNLQAKFMFGRTDNLNEQEAEQLASKPRLPSEANDTQRQEKQELRQIQPVDSIQRQDIFFRSGEYNSNNPQGLSAHELTHVARKPPIKSDAYPPDKHRQGKASHTHAKAPSPTTEIPATAAYTIDQFTTDEMVSRDVLDWFVDSQTQQFVSDLTASVRESPQHIVEILGEVWEQIQEYWPQFLAIFLGLLAAEIIVSILTGAPEPTLITKIVAIALQALILLVLGYFASVEAIEAYTEARNWFRLVTEAEGDPEKITAASLAFCRMMLHIALTILAIIGVRAKVRGIRGGAGRGLARPGQGHIPEANALSRAGQAIDRGNLTRAGRAFQKHGSRNPDIWGQPRGAPETFNTTGQTIVNEIINSSETQWNARHHARFGDIVEGTLPDRRGARWSADGSIFHGFLDP